MSDQPSSAPDPAPKHGIVFGPVADAYDRGRPSYPREAVEWLVGTEPVSILELGAGTGKLTELLVELGHDVFATDPDDGMLDVLSAKLPDVRATSGTAEQIPSGDGLYDVVIVGQAYHWFDLEAALDEIARVLRPTGKLALMWNVFDERIPWVRRLADLIGRQEGDADPTQGLDDSALFSAVETHDFRHWQIINRESIWDLVLSRSNVATLGESQREALRTKVLAFYDDYGRGMDGMQLPYTARCFRTQVLPHARPQQSIPIEDPETIEDTPTQSTTDTAQRLPRVLVNDDPEDTGTLLIDFR